jgi:sec-independent protein translocase protein TatB
MFDIGFWELMLIGIMGLVVLGPERLPVAIRTIKGWITGVRKFSDTVKSELSEELRIHELHANLKKAEQGDIKNLSPEVAESVKSLKEAAAMVNEPFKQIDTTAMDSMISASLANSPSNQQASSEVETSESKSKSGEEGSTSASIPPAIDESKK